MRSFTNFFLLLLLPCSAIAQDTTLTISPAMETSHYISLGNMNGWLFKKGHDIAWAKKEINLTGWEKLKPAELTEKLADKNGKLEGWLRIKIKLDTAFKDTPLDLFMNAWAASEIYVDGNLLNTFGNTGANGKPFKEYNPTYQLPVAFNVEKGNEHILAVHLVDFRSPLPPYHLKSEGRLYYFISITDPVLKAANYNFFLKARFFRTMWLSINAILCLLFWLLAFQNKTEKNLLLIAINSTIFAMYVYCDGFTSPGISYIVFKSAFLATPILRSAVIILGLLLMLRIFKRKITWLFKISLPLIIISGIAQLFSNNSSLLIFQVSVVILFYTYNIINSWRTLKGAQWAVLAGILVTASFGLLLSIAALTNPDLSISVQLVYTTGLFLSIPLSLLIYVGMRFKEIIKEVEQHAKQVLQLSEEKKEQALNQQKILQEEVSRQTAEIRTTLDNLKSTQSQLIQSEKMASLGELTAGIAHEIQNPLNFVNNFSEVNMELVDEASQEIDKENISELKAILNDIKENEKKINHHGKRADAIVKGMLQHSRSSSGVKEPTDINALADEYLRLAYHGLRAKDKSFNATMKTDYDDSIGNINVIPQDIGRVILNLITNAFYAASLPSPENIGTGAGGFSDPDKNHNPTVWVSTKKGGDKIFISVKDNGPGIPRKILDKIFQPFFTTKPTGQGTGLGLSLSYDIIKAHGGEIKVETKEDEGSTFIIQLPA